MADQGKVADQKGDQLLPLEKTQVEKEEDGVTVADTRKEHVSTFLYWFDQAVKLNHNHMELANVVAMMAMAEGLLSKKSLLDLMASSSLASWCLSPISRGEGSS